MELVDFITYCFNTVQSLLLVKTNLIPLALISIGVMLKMTKRVSDVWMILALWVIGMTAGWGLISPPREGALIGCVWAGVATVLDTKFYDLMAEKLANFAKSKLTSTNPPAPTN